MTTAPLDQIPGLMARETLTADQRDEMFALLSEHFDGVMRDQFERDLNDKNWVVEIRRAGQLLGFSTLLVTDATWDGTAITAIYSGDTIVAPEAWGSPLLARNWIAAVNSLRTSFAGRPCYWLLLTSGFRTYRFLPVFWREFHPRYNAAVPPPTARLLAQLARCRYGDDFDQGAGIVRFPNPQRLREPTRRMAAGRVKDQHVAYFLDRNPGHGEGDELVCLTEISESNLSKAGRRIVASTDR